MELHFFKKVILISVHKKNLVIMWFANFFVAASSTMVLPFLSLYIETLGSYSDGFTQKWSGYVFGVTFLMAFLVSPFWGRFGDKHGYKKILLITGTGIGTSILLMSIVSSVYELFFLRMAMGLVTGFIPTSLAMISAQTPKSKAGKTLGTLQMGTVSGGLFGPLLGGLLADHAGFTYTFFITAFVIYGAVFLVFVGVREHPLKAHRSRTVPYTRKQVLLTILKRRPLITVMVLTAVIQIGNFSVQPLLALYVSELHGPEHLAFFSGLAFSATGLGNLLAARKWGALGDRFGHGKILAILSLLAAGCVIPQGLTSTYETLVAFRFLFGIALGGMIPCITASIRVQTPGDIQGEVLGYNVSFRFLGNVIGPVLGGMLSSGFGISSAFYATAVLFFSGACLLLFQRSQQKKSEAKAS
ncbi:MULTISPECIES: MFS transporter [Bacillus]|uniref:MFS transporter n=1 Tax=Bacillus TaxID=1386 RepID=UPI00041CC176|nr:MULTISPECIES: MFS transporter [Bacillus]QHZ45794.1 multidrug efflux MFS transporter [Bacillus sp. NSP9.1]WFA04342.1 MFS transporter [Bacillus sp. HSf4]